MTNCFESIFISKYIHIPSSLFWQGDVAYTGEAESERVDGHIW